MKQSVVMISSTMLDLPDHRRKAMDACLSLDLLPKMMEHLPAIDEDVISASLSLVDEADIYLGIFAHRYGYVPAGHKKSITQMEYERAVKRGIPRLIFLMDKSNPVLPDNVDKGQKAVQLEELKRRLSTERVVGFFDSPDALQARIISGLRKVLHKPRPQVAKLREPFDSIQRSEVSIGYSNFLHTKITARGFLELRTLANPYTRFVDPTDIVELGFQPMPFGCLWLPSRQYLMNPPNEFTSISAICTVNPIATAITVREKFAADNALRAIPSRMLKEDKKRILKLMSTMLRDCFFVTVAIPALLLKVVRSNPKVAYQVICDLFLLPWLELHQRLGYDRFNLRIVRQLSDKDGDDLVRKLIKSIVRAAYPKRGTWSVEFAEDDFWLAIGRLTRLTAWAANALYNRNDSRWVELMVHPRAEID